MATPRARFGIAVAALLAASVLAPLTAPVAGAGPQRSTSTQRAAAPKAALPVLSGVEFRELYNRYEPVPGSRKLTSAPPITGNAAADAHIRSIATGRGYRLRSQHTGRLVTVLGVPVDSVAGAQLNALAGRAAAAGHRLGASYGYRSADFQRSIFLSKIGGYSASQIAAGQADGAIVATLRWVAIPGYSKHQSGMTLDLKPVGGSGGSFSGSGVGRWMAANNYQMAKEYGFIPSYPPGAGLQGPEPEPWEYVYVGRRVIECAVPLARYNDRIGFETCMGTSAIARKYASLGGAKGILGPVVTPEKANSDKRGRTARYRNGNIYWSPTTGAHEVHGTILTEFGEQGSVNGTLGYPTSDTLTTSDKLARYGNFEGGRIYYRSIGTFAVANPVFPKHEQFGGVHGALGYPVTSLRTTSDRKARYQDFQRGRIYVRSGRANEIHGAVLVAHQQAGGSAGALGYPSTDLGAAADGRGKAQWFERGLIWYASSTGAHGLWGPILQRYTANGNVRGVLGYPTSQPTAVGDGRGSVATFQGGRIYSSTTTAGFQVRGAVLTTYLSQFGGPQGELGYPRSELPAAGTPGGRIQVFEHGSLRFNTDGSVTRVA